MPSPVGELILARLEFLAVREGATALRFPSMRCLAPLGMKRAFK